MVVMGRIAEPYGIRGWVKVHPYTEYADGLCDYPVWWLGRPDENGGKWRQVAVEDCIVHGQALIAGLSRVADRTAAMQLKGLQVAVPRSQLPDLPETGEDGYYWNDLIGLEVVNLQNQALGEVAGLLETGANDVLQVRSRANPAEERLIPFIGPVIVKVDLKARRITVDWGADY